MFASMSATAGLRIRCRTLAVIVLVLAMPAFAMAQTVSDGTFLDANWSGTQFTAGNGGSSTGAQVLSGGNPGAYRNVVDVLNAAPSGSQTIVISTHIYTPFTYDPSSAGAIGSLDYSEDAACTAGCFGDGQSTGPALLQGGNLYILIPVVVTGPSSTWTSHALNGLTAADFGLVNVTPTTIVDPTQHPNFTASGGPIQFGFFRGNGTSLNGGGYTLAAGIDNWQITLAAAPPGSVAIAIPVPALGTPELALLAGLLALLAMPVLRRARSQRRR